MSLRYYPKSFRTLLLTAFLLTVLPLAVALLQAMAGIDRFAGQSRAAVGETAQAARASRALLDQATGLERLARQTLILRDLDLLADYETLRGQFKATGGQLAQLPLDAVQLAQLKRAVDAEEALFERLRQGVAKVPERARLVEDYAGLTRLANEVVDISNALIDRERVALERGAAETQRQLWGFLLAMLALGAGVALLASFLIGRPIRDLDAAIHRLGGGDLGPPVEVHGPADLEGLGQRLDWLRQRLADLEVQKTRFLRHVSHELKTPLTALREGAELLADGTAGPLAGTQREIVDILRQKSVQLQRLIERLLEAQQEMEGLARLRPRLLALQVLVARTAGEHRLAAAARRLELALNLVPMAVIGDSEKLATVIDNLLSNAIKHSPEGGVVQLALSRQGDSACLDVCDQGPGVAAPDRERIFDWFYQGEAPIAVGVAGSGLGLAIARELAQAHHGRLELIEDGRPGACFRLTLPVADKDSTV